MQAENDERIRYIPFPTTGTTRKKIFRMRITGEALKANSPQASSPQELADLAFASIPKSQQGAALRELLPQAAREFQHIEGQAEHIKNQQRWNSQLEEHLEAVKDIHAYRKSTPEQGEHCAAGCGTWPCPTLEALLP